MLEQAKQYSKTNYLSRNITIEYKFYDDECSSDKASGRVVEAMQDNRCIHMIIGLICDYCLGMYMKLYSCKALKSEIPFSSSIVSRVLRL